MCGIVGYAGERQAAPVLLDALKRLEYRGYDSAGIAVLDSATGNAQMPGIKVHKKEGRITELEATMPEIAGKTGIGHTRWATHGRPTAINAHPHVSGSIALVHNGIIENYQELKGELESSGYVFVSETDTEVLAHLVDFHIRNAENGNNLVDAVKAALQRAKGSYAIAVMSRDGQLVAARKDSPLIIGIGDGENFIASDVPAILKYTREVVYLDDYDIASVNKDKVEFFGPKGRIEKKISTIDWDVEAAEKAGYEHFMLKEIHEQPTSIHNTLAGRVFDMESRVELDGINLTADDVRGTSRILIAACGTSYNAGLFGKYIFELLAGIHTDIDLGSEFRYFHSELDESTLVIAVSQSGETADTLAAAREARSYGCRVIAISNIVGSTLARETKDILYTRAGPEIGVAATKTFTAQLVALLLLAIRFAKFRGRLSADRARRLLVSLRNIPGTIRRVLDAKELIEACANEFAGSSDYFFIGRGVNFPMALEGALKLKEISYIHAEGYAAGELKHGPLALITKGVPVVAIATRDSAYAKVLGNIKEVKAREASVIAIASEGDSEIENYVDNVIRIPQVDELLAPLLTAVVLQLLAYYTARMRNCPIDRPRNLAKSVTVE